MALFGGRYKPLLKAGLSLLYLRITGRRAPWYVNFFITSTCNLRCSYCYVAVNQGKLKEPSLEEVKDTIDRLHALGTRYICLLGGEPLIRNDLPEIVDHILAKDMLVALNTNGTIMKRHLDTLKKVHRIAISLEGTAETHDRDRGHGTFAKAVQTLEWLKANGIKGVAFQTTISENTRNDCLAVLDVAEKYGASVLYTEIGCGPGRGAEMALLSREELHDIWSAIRKRKEEGAPVENSYAALDAILKLGAHIGGDEMFGGTAPPVPPGLASMDRPCPMGVYNFFLNYDMKVTPCSSLFNHECYDGKVLGIEDAYRKMASTERCRVCRMRLNYQTDFLFSSFNPRTLAQIAMRALTSYDFGRTKT